MLDLLEHPDGLSPLILTAYVLVALCALGVLWRLSVQWQRHRVGRPARMRELLAWALVSAVAVALVAYAQDHFQRRAQAQRLQGELQERDRIASVLRARLKNEADGVRALLAERTVRHIERDTLTEARRDLARFAALADPRITQMISLIDTELEIRALVARSLSERSPQTLARVYARLSELEPGSQEYRDKAAQFATAAARGAP